MAQSLLPRNLHSGGARQTIRFKKKLKIISYFSVILLSVKSCAFFCKYFFLNLKSFFFSFWCLIRTEDLFHKSYC